jgi:hypothetical protein
MYTHLVATLAYRLLRKLQRAHEAQARSLKEYADRLSLFKMRRNLELYKRLSNGRRSL